MFLFPSCLSFSRSFVRGAWKCVSNKTKWRVTNPISSISRRLFSLSLFGCRLPFLHVKNSYYYCCCYAFQMCAAIRIKINKWRQWMPKSNLMNADESRIDCFVWWSRRWRRDVFILSQAINQNWTLHRHLFITLFRFWHFDFLFVMCRSATQNQADHRDTLRHHLRSTWIQWWFVFRTDMNSKVQWMGLSRPDEQKIGTNDVTSNSHTQTYEIIFHSKWTLFVTQTMGIMSLST